MIQQLAPLLQLNATSLDLTETEYNQLMSRPTFVIADPTTTAEREPAESPTRLEEVSLVCEIFFHIHMKLLRRMMGRF